jgi:hypothetical protein
MITVILESPYAGNIVLNTRYARACMHDCLTRFHEAPFASHLLYTQVGVLFDDVPEERKLGIEAGLAIGLRLEKTVVYTDLGITPVYTDLGITPGMELGIERARSVGRPVEFRRLEGWAA